MEDADEEPDEDSELLPLAAPLKSIEQDDDELEVLDDGDSPLDEVAAGFLSGKSG